MAMKFLKKFRLKKRKSPTGGGSISFNLLFIKGNLPEPDPETQRLFLKLTYRWLMFLIAVFVAIIFPDCIPYLKSITELIQHWK